MAIEISILIALLGAFVGLAGWLTGRDKRVANDAQWRGSVDAKLDLIVGIKTDIGALTTIVSDHSERIAKVEASASQAHHRLDDIRAEKNTK